MPHPTESGFLSPLTPRHLLLLGWPAQVFLLNPISMIQSLFNVTSWKHSVPWTIFFFLEYFVSCFHSALHSWLSSDLPGTLFFGSYKSPLPGRSLRLFPALSDPGASYAFFLGSINYSQRLISKSESESQFSFGALDSLTYMSQRRMEFSTLKMHYIISFPNCLFHFPSQWPVSLSILRLKPETLPSPPSFPYSHSQSVVQTILSLSPVPQMSSPYCYLLVWASSSFGLDSYSLRSLPTLLLGSFSKRKIWLCHSHV